MSEQNGKTNGNGKAKPRGHEFKLEWGTRDGRKVPLVENLTGTEAKAVAFEALMHLQDALATLDQQTQRVGRLTSIVVGYVYRDAQRGVLGLDGRPVVPIGGVLPADLLAIASEPWALSWLVRPDKSLLLQVNRPPPPPNAEPLVKLA